MNSLPYLSKTKRDEVNSAICDEAEAIIESEVHLSDSAHLDDDDERDKSPSSKKSKKSKGEYKLMEFIGDIIDPDDQEQTITAYQKANSEVK